MQRGELHDGPETLQLNLHNGCNLNCDFCWNHSPRAERPPPAWHREMLSDAHVDAIIAALPRLAPGHVLLSGQGEPLLHPGAERLLAALAALGVPVTVQTNGTLGPSPARLIELAVERLLINISAGTPEGYERVHPGRRHLFHAVVARASAIAAHAPPRPEVTLLAVIHERTGDQIEPLIELAAQVGAPRVVLKGIEHRDAQLDALGFTEPGRAEVRAALARVGPRARALGIELDATHLEQIVHAEAGDHAFTAELASGPCYMGWYYLRVTVDGRVMFCCKDKEVDHLDRRPLDRIWRSPGYHVLRLGGRDSDQTVGLLDAKCRACSNFARNRAVGRDLAATPSSMP